MMTEDELVRLQKENALLQAQVNSDSKRIDRVGKSLDSHLQRNHFAELFYESMRRKERKA